MNRIRTNPILSPEERILVLANLARAAAAESELRALVGGRVDYAELLKLAELNAVVPLTESRLEAAGATGLSARWSEVASPVRERNRKRMEWAKRLLEALAAAGVEVIVLKGSMLAEELYGDPLYKKMNDVDILVKRHDVERTARVLRETGFLSAGALFGKKEISTKSHHTPPYISEDLGCVVGLHWGLVSPLARWKPDLEAIWRRKAAIRVAGTGAFRMSWEDNLLHLCIHLPFYKTGLRELADVYNVALFGEGLDWERFAFRVDKWKAQDAAYRVLGLASALVDLGLPDGLLEKWRSGADAMTVKDTEARRADPSLVLRSRSTQVARIEKAYAIFALSAKYSERATAWAGMWAMLLWPKEEDALRIMGTRGRGRVSVARARLAAPGRIWNAMARDHGAFSLAAITAINAGIMARETLLKPLRKDGPSLREHPAAGVLEALE